MASDTMNRLIQASRRNRVVGLMDRGADLDERRQDALNEAMARVESAIKTGDHILIQQAEERLDAVLAEARAARPDEQQEPTPRVSFDGGYRGRRPVAPTPHARVQSASQLFRQAMEASRAERATRHDDQVITINR